MALLLSLLIFGLILFGAYFLPSIIANARGHRDQLAIFLLNICFGWTVFGWLALLVWAFVVPHEKKPQRFVIRSTPIVMRESVPDSVPDEIVWH